MQTIAPRADLEEYAFNPTDNIYCRFVRASKSKTRGSLNIYPPVGDTSDTIIIPAS